MIRDFTSAEALHVISGTGATILLTLIAFIGGGLFGLLTAIARTSGYRGLSYAAEVYISLFQGIPPLMLLFLAFYGLPIAGLSINAWVAASVGFTLHASAFLGDIWRGGIQAIPRGQNEAALALSLGYWTRLRYILLPQALRITLAPTVGFAVQLVKGTSLAAMIGFIELTRSAQIVSSITYRPLLAFGLAGACYFVICFPLSRVSQWLERRYSNRSAY
jgi:polar amino acid transport system permease protein